MSEASQDEEDDLDGGANYYDGDGHNFGEEPYGTILDNWACDHNWFLASTSYGHGTYLHCLETLEISTDRGTSTGNRPVRTGLECNRCFRVVVIEETVQNQSKFPPDEDTKMAGTSPPRWPTNISGEPGWQCHSGHFGCDRCPKSPPSHRAGDETWQWSCDCGKVCQECDKPKARKMQTKENAMAWECGCGVSTLFKPPSPQLRAYLELQSLAPCTSHEV